MDVRRGKRIRTCTQTGRAYGELEPREALSRPAPRDDLADTRFELRAKGLLRGVVLPRGGRRRVPLAGPGAARSRAALEGTSRCMRRAWARGRVHAERVGASPSQRAGAPVRAGGPIRAGSPMRAGSPSARLSPSACRRLALSQADARRRGLCAPRAAWHGRAAATASERDGSLYAHN